MKCSRLHSFAWLVAGLSLFTNMAHADVTLPKIFSEHMVLQADRKDAPVWGKAAPGEKVTVTLGDKKAETKAGDDGKWSVRIETPHAGGPLTLVVEGNNKIEIADVLVGEVWVASGQSNMEWTVNAAEKPQEEKAAANYPQIRMFTVQKHVSKDPVDDVNGKWVVCSPDTVLGFSAVGYFFARKVHEELKVPVGILNSSWGGTICEAWTSHATLASEADFAPILDRAKDFKGGNPNQASVLYNGMIHPLIPYAIRGAIWYQGESNLSRAEQYAKLFPAMIRDWRKLWNQGDFSFYFVQLAPYAYNKKEDTKQLPELWEAQTKTLSLPNTGMAVTTDITNIHDIHPKNKQDVGRRLALWALNKTYGKGDVVYSGPLYESMSVEGNKVRIKFKHAEGGLTTKENKPVTHFTISGEDKKFVEATAKIEGDAIIVSSDQVANPVAVRFGWSDTAEPNLFNKAGLPASPFRTDNFPMVTAGRK